MYFGLLLDNAYDLCREEAKFVNDLEIYKEEMDVHKVIGRVCDLALNLLSTQLGRWPTSRPTLPSCDTVFSFP